MIVSILQMMGFPKGKPDKVRAQETNAEKLQKAAANPAPAPRKTPDVPDKKKAEAKTNNKEKAVVKAKPKKKEANAATEDVKNDTSVAEKLVDKKPTIKNKEKNKPVNPLPNPVKLAETPPPLPETTKQKVVKTAKVAQAKVVEASANATQTIANVVQAVKEPVKKAAVKAVVAAVKPVVNAVRPSSRLASITVPSMAQAVASTAAKSSYSQTPSSPAMETVIPAIVKKDTKLANNWKSKPVAQLTDAELLAMPDSEYMNEVQLAAFRLKLSVLKSSILSNAGETTEHLREESSVVPDPADRATIEEEHALELRTRDRERKLLKKIEQSIVRIDAGDYGYCDETGEPIGVGRLLARPTATLSLEAQQRRELKQKMFGD